MFDASKSLGRGAEFLIQQQKDGGDWEGEVVWCPLLAAQYCILCHLTGTKIPKQRRERVLRHFEDTQLSSGLWGLHEESHPYLFVTSLVYVAARTLGVSADAPLLKAARGFFEHEDLLTIPSWGKLWLAIMNVYDWDGVHPVQPEAWLMPRKVPLHPSNYYCHTRMIYLGMASLYGVRMKAPRSALIDELREELYPGREFNSVPFAQHRGSLRKEDLYARPTPQLRALYKAAGLGEKMTIGPLRRRALADLREKIRWELRTTDHTCVSPVSGMVSLLALWHWDKKDPDFVQGMKKFEGWIWEDDEEGFRVAGARSGTWDTAFALQALKSARHHISDSRGAVRRSESVRNGATWLATQQIAESFDGYKDNFRVDPKGGFCFAGVWHGWPVSDCTAEALTALYDTSEKVPVDDSAMCEAVKFMLRCQNSDGGFGTYEPSKTPFDLEWMNPAEMFGDSMIEPSHIECTASCLSAIVRFRDNSPAVSSDMSRTLDRSIARGVAWLRTQQGEDGSFVGAWGICFTYGTMFAIRGLRRAGVSVHDEAIVGAVNFLKSIQHRDGAFGEDWRSCVDATYRHGDAHATQTAWGLMGLIEGECEDHEALSSAAKWLTKSQEASGDWPRQMMCGVFFHTALLDYRLYRRYFPLWALGLYESKRVSILANRSAASQQPVHA